MLHPHNPASMLNRLFFSLLLFALPLAQVLADESPVAVNNGLELLEFVVEGNSTLSSLEIEQAVYPSLGPGKSIADIEKARAALEAAYQQSGYLSVSVMLPEQQIKDGVVRLQVVEGKVEKLKVSGNQYTLRSQLREEVPELAPGSVPHFPTMQAELGQASRSADRRVTPLLRPGSRLGTTEVELAVEDALPLHGNIEMNNRQSPSGATDRRLETGIRYTNLFQKQHAAGLNYVVTPDHPEEVNVISGFYSLPVDDKRTLSFSAQRSNSNIDTAVGSAMLGKGLTLGLRLNWTLPVPSGLPGFFHSLSLGADWKNLEETLSSTSVIQRPLKYLPVAAQYTFGVFDESGEWLGNLGLVTNISRSERMVDCGGIQKEQFECRRTNARPNFALVRGDLAYSKRMFGWEGSAKVDFQLSGQALVSPEQFLAGGMDSVRGYYEGEAAGDSGWRWRTEVKTPSLLDVGGAGLRLLGFAEGAHLWRSSPLVGEIVERDLFSTGIGLRWQEKRGFSLMADLGRVGKSGDSSRRNDEHLHVRLGYEF
jgi:hemolysin activation/secretion protein